MSTVQQNKKQMNLACMNLYGQLTGKSRQTMSNKRNAFYPWVLRFKRWLSIKVLSYDNNSTYFQSKKRQNEHDDCLTANEHDLNKVACSIWFIPLFSSSNNFNSLLAIIPFHCWTFFQIHWTIYYSVLVMFSKCKNKWNHRLFWLADNNYNTQSL